MVMGSSTSSEVVMDIPTSVTVSEESVQILPNVIQYEIIKRAATKFTYAKTLCRVNWKWFHYIQLVISRNIKITMKPYYNRINDFFKHTESPYCLFKQISLIQTVFMAKVPADTSTENSINFHRSIISTLDGEVEKEKNTSTKVIDNIEKLNISDDGEFKSKTLSKSDQWLKSFYSSVRILRLYCEPTTFSANIQYFKELIELVQRLEIPIQLERLYLWADSSVSPQAGPTYFQLLKPLLGSTITKIRFPAESNHCLETILTNSFTHITGLQSLTVIEQQPIDARCYVPFFNNLPRPLRRITVIPNRSTVDRDVLTHSAVLFNSDRLPNLRKIGFHKINPEDSTLFINQIINIQSSSKPVDIYKTPLEVESFTTGDTGNRITNPQIQFLSKPLYGVHIKFINYIDPPGGNTGEYPVYNLSPHLRRIRFHIPSISSIIYSLSEECDNLVELDLTIDMEVIKFKRLIKYIDRIVNGASYKSISRLTVKAPKSFIPEDIEDTKSSEGVLYQDRIIELFVEMLTKHSTIQEISMDIPFKLGYEKIFKVVGEKTNNQYEGSSKHHYILTFTHTSNEKK